MKIFLAKAWFASLTCVVGVLALFVLALGILISIIPGASGSGLWLALMLDVFGPALIAYTVYRIKLYTRVQMQMYMNH